MSETFPTLTSGINDWDSFEEDYLVDPTIRTPLQGGRQLSRTGVEPLVKVWRYMRRGINTADKVTLDSWQASTVGIGGTPFTWTDPRPSGSTWTVRLGSPIKFRPFPHRAGSYDALIHVIEESALASPSSSPSASASASPSSSASA